ncbi:hypothetical protein BDM02DRAFT_3129464 [Thelephora ganbajun]|uniref:Uncharacterized protein n=1 Tax=Thelephora ganbajun TaxID=370292 RepID=A0ACB6ZE73_THEGA|nr:hypothetical protein BDM02DRAFT_3129464 [Thelephora ganbajun]
MPTETALFRKSAIPVSNIGDLSIPAKTFRARFLGLTLILTAACAANCCFMFRYPSTALTPQILVLLAHPMAKMWSNVLARSGSMEFQDKYYGIKNRLWHENSPGGGMIDPSHDTGGG